MTGHDIIKQLREMEHVVPELTRDCEYLLFQDGDEACRFRSDMGNPDVDWMTGDDLATFFSDMRNNADLLLSIAEAFQPGDADALHWTLTGGGDFDDIEDKQPRITDLLSRLQAAAARLESTP